LQRKAIQSSGVRHGTPRASYHFDPSRFLIELYTDMDVIVPELDIFEPRPWHEAFPQRPRVWTLDHLTTWGTRFDFDFKAI
jgi:hypothetical protein